MPFKVILLGAAVVFFVLAGLKVQANVDFTNLGFACVTASLFF